MLEILGYNRYYVNKLCRLRYSLSYLFVPIPTNFNTPDLEGKFLSDRKPVKSVCCGIEWTG